MDALDQQGAGLGRGISTSQRNRRTAIKQTDAELDALAAEFHARLPRERATAVGAFYARFSTKDQDSVTDQVRSLFEGAIARRIFVPRENICFDVAVRGTKARRPGFDRLLSILDGKGREVEVVMVFSTNRLYRKMYRALQFVEEQLVDRRVRCIFLSQNIDTANQDQWRTLVQINAMTDEMVGGMSANHVRAAHEGLFGRGMVTGSLPVGYRGRDVPGERTRRNRPRRAVEVDPDTSPWILRIFGWFADDRVAISEIARRLNEDPDAPRGSQFVIGVWSAKTVRHLLANERYAGLWQYGVCQNVWQNRGDYSRPVRRDIPLRSARMDDLRIVPEDLWERAQRRLAANDRRAAGRKPRDGDRSSRPRLLNGLFRCPTHDRRLYVGGPNGHMLFCNECRGTPAATRPLYTLLNRRLALELTCEALARLLGSDSALVDAVIARCRTQAASLQQPDPGRIRNLKAQREGLSRQIDFVLANPGDSELDRDESRARLKRLRQERVGIAAELEALERSADRPPAIPNESEVRELVEKFGAILTSAASGQDEAGVPRAREIVELLTGGQIDLVQMGERKAQRGWLQGRFRVRLLNGMVETLTGVSAGEDHEAPTASIDFRSSSPTEAMADRVKELYDQGLLIKAVAAELEITRNMASKALDLWHTSRGLPKPDGRSRRSELERKHSVPPKFIALSEEIMGGFASGQSYEELADRYQCDRGTVAKVIRRWHDLRGLTVPDGRNRRKELNRRRRGEVDQVSPSPAA